MSPIARFGLFGVAFVATSCVVAPGARGSVEDRPITVSAASSLTDALGEIGTDFERLHPGSEVRLTFGSSGTLQRQIEQGAPVDVFISASPQEMDALQARHLVKPGTRFDMAGNLLVLVRATGRPVSGWRDLTKARRVAISNPENVPSGRYAKQTLVKRGLWDVVQQKAVYGNTARQTLSYAVDGNADCAVVFMTDAMIAGGNVDLVDRATPGVDHPPIVYPAAEVAGAPNGVDAGKFLIYLHSPEAKKVLSRYGFQTGGTRP